MTYKQTVNPLQLDLLWGESPNHNYAKDSINNVVITMKHALAKVNIFFDSSLGEIKQAKVSAYKAGYFSSADNGVPNWIVDDETNIQTAFVPSSTNQKRIVDATVFILPKRITGLSLIKLDKTEIDVSDKIQNIEFKAGKVYNLNISLKGVRKKNTNSRSIAMSVRCVSE